MPRDWRRRLRDIVDAIDRILRYTEDMDYDAFREDDRTVDAVIRNVTVIGEAARHIPDQITHRHPDLPWAEMRGIRNVTVHEYFGVSVEILWETIQTDLPTVKPQLQEILQQAGDNGVDETDI